MTDEKKEVSLQDVYDQIKQESKEQMVFGAAIFGATIVIAGVSMLAATFPAYSLKWNAIGIIIFGFIFLVWCVIKAVRIKRQRKDVKKQIDKP